ncbi:MAG TPA: hypothetical protein VNZ26_01265 [Vicinamibacterales bacterium]|nr:hypothetical protein [Vicinamibacterales bacterium]
MAIQVASVDADHAHSRAAVTLAVPCPPFAPNPDGDKDIDTAHFVGDGSVVSDDEEPQLMTAVNKDEAATTRHTRRSISSRPGSLMATRFITPIRLARHVTREIR